MARTHRHCGTSVYIFAMVSGGQNQVLEICCIHQYVASAKMVATLFGLDATTGDVADLLLLRMGMYVLFFRWKQLGDWKEASSETWHRFESEFVAFIAGRGFLFV